MLCQELEADVHAFSTLLGWVGDTNDASMPGPAPWGMHPEYGVVGLPAIISGKITAHKDDRARMGTTTQYAICWNNCRERHRATVRYTKALAYQSAAVYTR